MSNPFRKLVQPYLPPAALGLTSRGAGVITLDRRRDIFTVRRAASASLPEGLLNPDFNETNVTDVNEMADLLAELVTSAGLGKRRRWSAALPEAATRTAILTLESATGSRAEVEEMLNWKTERSFGATLAELRCSRLHLPSDAQGRPRYVVCAVRLSVLAEYEAVFAALGWHAGLILPRHMGEAWWLMRDSSPVDSLLVSAHHEGFTAVLLRGGQPLLIRGVICDAEDRADELYRFLLFYRDRLGVTDDQTDQPSVNIGRLFVTGNISEADTSAIIAETLNTTPRTLRPEDVRLALPSDELDFNLMAAPAGLAALAWA